MWREAPWASTGGRQSFSTEFKRSTVQRILTGEKTLAERAEGVTIWKSPTLVCQD
jgi:transposase-like protein